MYLLFVIFILDHMVTCEMTGTTYEAPDDDFDLTQTYMTT